jgi:hypothetical protein
MAEGNIVRGIRASSDSSDFLLEFDSASNDFYRGFQCGEIWACLIDGVKEIQSIISADNSEMILRMTEATGYSFEGRYLTEEEIHSLDLEPGEWMVVAMRSS